MFFFSPISFYNETEPLNPNQLERKSKNESLYAFRNKFVKNKKSIKGKKYWELFMYFINSPRTHFIYGTVNNNEFKIFFSLI